MSSKSSFIYCYSITYSIFSPKYFLPGHQSSESIIDPSLFKWGTPRKSVDELRSIVTTTELTGLGWIGDAVAVEWNDAITEVIKRKSKKLRSKGFCKYEENWLVVYDNLKSFALNVSGTSSMLTEKLRAYWSGDSFGRVYVETGNVILEFGSRDYTCHKINDLWRKHPRTN